MEKRKTNIFHFCAFLWFILKSKTMFKGFITLLIKHNEIIRKTIRTAISSKSQRTTRQKTITVTNKTLKTAMKTTKPHKSPMNPISLGNKLQKYSRIASTKF